MIINYKTYKNLLKIYIIIHLLFYNKNILSYFNILINYISYQYEIKGIEKYLKICQDLKIMKKFKKSINP